MESSDLSNKPAEHINDDDPVIKLLDELESKSEYEKILQKIDEIPEDKWSKELRYIRVNALIRLSRINEAKSGIHFLYEHCPEPDKDPGLYYLLGCLFAKTDRPLSAAECFLNTQKYDPDYEGIQDAVDVSMERAGQDMADAKSILKELLSDISEAIENAGDQTELDEDNAFTYVSMIRTSFLSLGLGIEIPLDKLFFKCADADKLKMKKYLEEKFGIHDLRSLQQWYVNNRAFAEFIYYLNPEEKETDETEPAEMVRMKAAMLVCQYFKDLIPKACIIAWDFCSVIALARMAYACDLLSNTEFMETALFFTDESKKRFSSWEEFSRSAVIGGFYNSLCYESKYDIKAATLFGKGACLRCKQVYPKVTWIS